MCVCTQPVELEGLRRPRPSLCSGRGPAVPVGLQALLSQLQRAGAQMVSQLP